MTAMENCDTFMDYSPMHTNIPSFPISPIDFRQISLNQKGASN